MQGNRNLFKTPPPPQALTINRDKPYVTYALLALNVAAYVAELVFEYLIYGSHAQMLVALGAKINVLITLGQYWRLITATFLHSGVTHILCNMFALFIWGRQIEQILGKWRYLSVYLFAGAFGCLFSYLFSDATSVGASGAIFGLLGCLLYFRLRHKQLFDRVFGMQVLIIIAINLVSGFLGQGIDNLGHIGGLTGGFLASFATGLYKERPTAGRIAVAAALLALLLGGLCWGIVTQSKALGVEPFTFLSVGEVLDLYR